MGDLAKALNSLTPRRAAAESRTAIPVGTSWGAPNPLPFSYETYAREGYGKNELVYACVEALSTSAAEPEPAVWRKYGGRKAESHPVLDLLRQPNPYLSGFNFIAGLIMYRAIGGTAFWDMTPSAAGRVVELWPIRPDRMTPIPHPTRFLDGWKYQNGATTLLFPPERIGSFKTRNPLDEYRGMPPLSVIAERVDIDNWMRQFVGAFFKNAGVPAGLLNVMRKLDEDEERMIKNRFRDDFGGPAGWMNLLVLSGAEAKYEPMGLAIGQRGLMVDGLDKIDEARISMAFSVPLSIIGALVGQESSSYANRREDKALFWENALAPLYQDLGDALTMSLGPHFPDVERIGFDLSTVQALQPDVDKLHDRVRADMESGGITQEEFREQAGYGPPPTQGTYVIKTALTAVQVGQLALPAPAPNTNGQVPALIEGGNGTG